jgi:hypothetical protein
MVNLIRTLLRVSPFTINLRRALLRVSPFIDNLRGALRYASHFTVKGDVPRKVDSDLDLLFRFLT